MKTHEISHANCRHRNVSGFCDTWCVGVVIVCLFVYVSLISGDEFLMPLQAFFCSLCCEFSKDSISAEAHLKSREHNNKFKV